MSFKFSLNQALTGQQILSLTSHSMSEGNIDIVVDKVVNPSSVQERSLFFCKGLPRLSPSPELLTSICLASPVAVRHLPKMGLVVEVQDPIAEISNILAANDASEAIFQTEWIDKLAIFNLQKKISGEIDSTALISTNTEVGQSSIIGPNAQIGVAGLGFVDRLNGERIRVPHLGRVRLGNQVVIGTGSVLVRGQFSDTVLMDGVRLGNLVNVGHNCTVGSHTVISSGSVIGGGCMLGSRVELGVGVTVAPKVTIGDGAFVTAGSVVLRNVRPYTTVCGNPAVVVRRGNISE